MKGGMQDRMKEVVDRIIRTLGPRRLMRGMKGQHKNTSRSDLSNQITINNTPNIQTQTLNECA